MDARRLIRAAILAALVFGGWAWYEDVGHECGRHASFTTIRSHRGFCRSPERPALTFLKMIASAQADFRANNPDGDGVNQFWRTDVAGLFALAQKGGPAIQLIPLDLALADARPFYDLSGYGKRQPKSGYWFKAIRHADETTIDAVTQFAVCAYPDDLSRDKYTFVVDENNRIFRTATPLPQGVDVFPTAEELKAQWNIVG